MYTSRGILSWLQCERRVWSHRRLRLVVVGGYLAGRSGCFSQLVNSAFNIESSLVGCFRNTTENPIGEEASKQLDIVAMEIRVRKHLRKVTRCRGCETAPAIN